MAKLKKPLFGVAGGEVYPRSYEAGEECPPELVAAAEEIGALETAKETGLRLPKARFRRTSILRLVARGRVPVGCALLSAVKLQVGGRPELRTLPGAGHRRQRAGSAAAFASLIGGHIHHKIF